MEAKADESASLFSTLNGFFFAVSLFLSFFFLRREILQTASSTIEGSFFYFTLRASLSSESQARARATSFLVLRTTARSSLRLRALLFSPRVRGTEG